MQLAVLSPWQYCTFCALSTYPYSYLYRTSYAVASLILTLLRINPYITHDHLSFAGKKRPALLLPIFKYFSVSMFVSLPFGTSLMLLLSLLSAVLVAVAFRHLATKSSFYFASFYFILFSRAEAIDVSPLFSMLGLQCHLSLLAAIFSSSRYY